MVSARIISAGGCASTPGADGAERALRSP
jgi:hypothetical protein